ncbi:MAG TPA: WG repeat-containing protein [Stackebrandtia sp.]|jgi:tetratricopeptide (TPR) repeat protein|uniref:WG repeat-containing protein n=1 Tax=Stackebrandtia sp. TaxID=2023065 RepID=UPI002D4A226F|nr:WG repeat-containing protein [Stackebrandtia sp.]HZE41818.1 WG repeat-containing protein [Stackebrandtia sp.]
MADVAADLRAALHRALGPIDIDTLNPQVSDPQIMSAIANEASNRLDNTFDEADRARLLGVRSVAQRALGELSGAEADAKTALSNAERIGTDLLLAPARARLGQVMRNRGDYAQADKLYALAEAGELPRRFLGRVRACAALSCISQRRLTEALLHLERATEYTSDEATTASMAPALELVYRLAVEGFGPSPRSWAERADFPAPRLFQDPRSGGWGYLGPDKSVVIPAAFAEAGEFRGGIAAVRERAWGAINTAGEQVVPFLYDRVSTTMPDGRSVVGFVDGVAVVDRRGAKGLVNRTGKVILPPHHRDIVVHPAGYAIDHGSSTWSAVNHNGEEIVPARFRRADVLQRLDGMVNVDDGPL